jgi:GTPase SAR1 family protein
MYDVTSYLSFVSAKTWIEELWERGDCNPELVIALVGNKVDLLEPEPSKNKNKNNNNNVMNTLEEADAYAREVNILHLGTSAKTATNVKALFYKIAKKLPKPKIDPLPPDDDDNNDEQETLIVAAAAAAASEASPQGNCERISVTVRRVLASSMAATLLCCFKRKRRRGG